MLAEQYRNPPNVWYVTLDRPNNLMSFYVRLAWRVQRGIVAIVVIAFSQVLVLGFPGRM